MRPPTPDVDHYDGHILSSFYEDPEQPMVHEVIHPPTCQPVDRGGYLDHACHIAFCVDQIGSECWVDATTPGKRVIGWRHETVSCGWGAVEHDLICWALPNLLPLPVDLP